MWVIMNIVAVILFFDACGRIVHGTHIQSTHPVLIKVSKKMRNSYTTVCPHTRGSNPRGLANVDLSECRPCSV